MQRYTAFDVETPNGKGDAICQIGLVVAEGDDIILAQCFLVDPQTWFDPTHISIHHITPRMVEDAPTFPEVWTEIAPYFSDTVLLAHNARFDLGVLSATLKRYGLPVPETPYCCTYRMAQRRFPRTLYGSYKLRTLAAAYDIPLEQHHDALCDAKACFELFRWLRIEYGDDPRDIRQAEPTRPPAMPAGRFSETTRTDVRFRELSDILSHTDPTLPLSPSDRMAIRHWLHTNECLAYDEETRELYSVLYALVNED